MSLRAQHVGIFLNKFDLKKFGAASAIFALVPGGTAGRTQQPHILF